MKLFRRIFRKVTVQVTAQPVPAGPSEGAPARVDKQVYLRAGAMTAPDRQLGRLRVIGMVVALAFVCVSARAVQISVLSTPDATPRFRMAEELPQRGMILDRDGEILASTLDFHTVYVDPYYVWDDDELVSKLLTVLPELDADWLNDRLKTNTRYIEIATNVSPRVRQAIHLLGLAGVFFDTKPGRIYPKRRAASHLIGYTGRDMTGLSGAERAFEAELSEGDRHSVYLSIDLTAQHRVESILRERIAHYRAEGGLAVLMRVGTGEIIAMASMPDFDLNHWDEIVSGTGDSDPRFNKAITGVYELGSVFKPLALTAGMQAGLVDLDDVFDATHPVRIGGHVIEDWRGERRPLTAREIILYSSNIGSSRMADIIGGDVLRDFYRDLRLMEPVPIELSGSAEPVFPRRWGRIQTMTASYGHGFQVSPLALTAAYGALANGGVYVPPTLRPLAPGEVVTGEPVVDPQIAAQVLAVMRENISRSQTGSADIPGLAVAGKTGTAERVVNGAYEEGNLFTTFVGIFPFDDPRYVLTVSLDRPQPAEDTFGFNTAGWTAMPTAGAIMRDLAGVLDLEHRNEDPAARISAVRDMFAPRVSVRIPAEEPVALVDPSIPAGEQN